MMYRMITSRTDASTLEAANPDKFSTSVQFQLHTGFFVHRITKGDEARTRTLKRGGGGGAGILITTGEVCLPPRSALIKHLPFGRITFTTVL